MTDLESSEIKNVVGPMLTQPLSEAAWAQLAEYVRLLYRWNGRINLTAIRDPKTLVALHLAECLRAAQRIPDGVKTVLDFGSGAGLPGIPIQIARPDIRVTLAESQQKKAAFLREAIRTLGLSNACVHAGRVEDLPRAHVFDLVTLRAVDRMAEALRVGSARIGSRGCCMVLTSEAGAPRIVSALATLQWETEPVPGTRQRVLLLGQTR